MKKQRLFYLDFIRTMAIFIVIVFHYNERYRINHPDAPARTILAQNILGISPGHLGVSLFLIISGASLWYVYRERFSARAFYRKRFFSLFPYFWIAYAVALAVRCAVTQPPDAPLWTLIFTVFGLDGLVYVVMPNWYLLGEWFLGLIILYYLIFPLIRRLMQRSRLLPGALALALYAIFMCLPQQAVPQNMIPFTRLPEFLFGIYFMEFWCARKPGNSFPPRVIPGFAAILCGCALVLCPLPEMVRVPILGASLFLLLGYISRLMEKLPRIPEIFSATARYSYCACLTHHVIIQMLERALPLDTWDYGVFVLCFLLVLLLTAAASWVLYHFTGRVAGFVSGRLSKPVS